jgi:catalase
MERTMPENNDLTTNTGKPVENDLNSMTAGPLGPSLLQDVHLIEKLAHFDRERIPDRVVHAKGAGAGGFFEVTHDVTKYTRAKFLSKVGKRTEVFARFSLVGGENMQLSFTQKKEITILWETTLRFSSFGMP